LANAAVTKDLANQSEDDKATSASLVLNFGAGGECSGDMESTGTIALIYADGDKNKNYVDVSATKDYCFSAELRPVFVLKAAKKDQAPCSDPKYNNAKEVSNNYFGIYVNALSQTAVSGAAKQAEVDRSRKTCAANGVSAADCLKD